jgi:hypothetical protein
LPAIGLDISCGEGFCSLVERAVHSREASGPQMAEIGVVGTSYQYFASAGAVARQLLY